MTLSHVGREIHGTLLFSAGLLLGGISHHTSNTFTLLLKGFDCTSSEDDQRTERRRVKEEREVNKDNSSIGQRKREQSQRRHGEKWV